MGDCNVINNVRDELLKEGLIDSGNNVIGKTSEVYSKMASINEAILNKYGSFSSGGKRLQLVDTYTVPANFARSARVKMSFNENYANHVEGVQNKTNRVFDFLETGKSVKSSEVLQKIADNKSDPMSELAASMVSLAKKNDVQVSLVTPSEMEQPSWQGVYDSGPNSISISTGARNNTATRTIVHEIIHALTVNEINNNPDSKAVKDLQKLYEDTLWLTDKKDLYGYKNVREFAVAVLTDPKVIQDMRNMPKSGNVNTSSNNLLEQVVNKLLEIVGLKKMSENILKQAVSTVTDIMQDGSYYNKTNDFNFTNAQEEEYWNSIITAQNENDIDVSDFSQNDGIQSVIDFDQPLNSPINIAPNTVISYPDSFAEWVATRKTSLENLKRVHDYYFKLDKKDPILMDVNRAIEEMEDQLANVDYEDPYLIFDNAVSEAEVLSILINKAKEYPEEALNIIETNDLEKRVEDLNYYFLGLDKNLGDTAYNANTSESEFFRDYNEEFGQFNVQKMKDLRNSIREVKENFKNIKKNVVVSAFKSNSFTKQHAQSGKLTAKNIENIVERIENGEYEVDLIGSHVLGLGSGGGILGQIIKLRRDEAGDQEKAHVANKLAPMNKVWEKIKNVKDANGNYITDALYQVDKFGVRMGRLAGKYSDSFHFISKSVASEAKSFMATKDSRDFARWMKAEKDNYERIDVRRFASIFTKYATDPRFSRDFDQLDMAQAQAYEDKLRDKLGPVMFEIEKKKAEDLIEDFMHGYDTGILTPLQKTAKNPFRFLKNFNSPDFDKKDIGVGRFVEPTYTSFIPSLDDKNNDFFDKNFKKIEENPDLAEYYKGAYDLMTNYANPTFQGEGINVGTLDVQTFEDILERNSYKDLSLMGKISANAKALYINRVQKYSDASLAQMEERLSDKTHNRQKLAVAYSGDIRGRIAKIKGLYVAMGTQTLINEANNRLGVNLTPNMVARLDKSGKEIRTPLFYEVAESLARQDFNKITSTNIQESLHNSAYLAADVRARRSVVAMVEAFKDVATMASVRKGDSVDNKKQTNIAKMIHMWAQSNIYGEKFAGNMEDKGNGILSKIARTKLAGAKTYTGTDRLTIKQIEKILEFATPDGVKTFTYEENEYKVEKGKVFKGTEEITFEQFKKVYGKMLKDNIGTDMTIGSVMLGYMDNLRSIQLGLSPRGGIKNRIAGMSQSMAVAASKKFGFDLNDYHASRRFLRGVNSRNYVSKVAKFAINENNPKYVQIRMLEELISNLELQQNRADELAMEAKFDSAAGSQKIESLKNFLMDFAMNNPEKHNQLELAVSLMMNTEVFDDQGNSHKFFNGKKLEFTMYKPGTLELKDEFRTPKNEAMWENFQTFKDPATGEQSSDSIAMTSKIRATIEQTQGNYNNDDIIMLQNTVHGKLATMYTRYMYENTNLQFGKHHVDLRTGEMDIKGRKINLAEHAPTTLIYLTSNFGVPLIASAVTFAALSPWVAAVAGVGAAVTIGMMIKTKSLNVQSVMAKKEWLLAKDFALETLLLMGKTPLNTFSYGSINPKAIDSQLGKLQAKNYGGMITEKDRLTLSECAQEVATKFTNYSMYTLTALLAKFLFTALVGGDDDDDENYVQSKIKDLVNIENVVNALLNDRNQVLGDINRYLSPSQFYNDATAFSFFRSLARDGMTTYKVANGYYEDKETSQMVSDIAKLTYIPGSNMIPNNAKKAIIGMFTGDVGVFSDNRVYEGKDGVDKSISKNMKKGEAYYTAEAKDLRKSISNDAKDYFEKQIKAEGEGLNRTEIKDEVARRVREFMKDVTKSKNMTYQDLIESGAFDAKKEEMEILLNE